MDKDRVKAYVKNHKEISDSNSIVIFDVDGDDVLKVMDSDPGTDSWDTVYYLKVKEVINKIDKLFPY